MELLKDRRVVVGGGIALALLAGVGVAVLWGAGKDGPDVPPPASQGGLVVEIGREDVKLDPTRQLPCYVNGVSVGLTTHAECASRNGVSSGQLDVGIDQTGAMAFGEAGAALVPLPPPDEPATPALPPLQTVAVAEAASTPPVVAPRGPTAACWRYADRAWSRIGDMAQGACVVALFDGRCERQGSATYGRWGEQTLRLVPGRVEQSPDNRNFRTLAEQGTNCTVGPL